MLNYVIYFMRNSKFDQHAGDIEVAELNGLKADIDLTLASLPKSSRSTTPPLLKAANNLPGIGAAESDNLKEAGADLNAAAARQQSAERQYVATLKGLQTFGEYIGFWLNEPKPIN